MTPGHLQKALDAAISALSSVSADVNRDHVIEKLIIVIKEINMVPVSSTTERRNYETAVTDAALEWIRRDDNRGHTTDDARLDNLDRQARALDAVIQRQLRNQP